MKSIDFETGQISESQNNVVIINEFLMTALAVGVISYYALSAGLTAYSNIKNKILEIRKINDERRKIREERLKAREERKKEREAYKEKREKERDKKRKEREAELNERESRINNDIHDEQVKAYKAQIAAERSVQQLNNDNNQKQAVLDRLKLVKKINRGEASQEEISTADQHVKSWKPSPEEKKLLSKTNEQIEKNISDETVEKHLEKENITPQTVTQNIQKNNSNDQASQEVIKDMEVEDPETGKKVMRKVHIGPQGGKYYWPDGVPHDAEHKVYVNQ